jgi:hypothetical protein
MLELVKALQITIAITALAIVVVYLPLTIRVAWEKPKSQTTHWIMAKLLMWVSQAIAFEYLWYSYAFGGVPVFVNPGLPNGWRVAYLAAELMAGTYFLAARAGMLWPRFFVWAACMAFVVAWVLKN